MVRTVLIMVAVAAVGCGGSSDDCTRFVDKSKPVMKEMGKSAGKEFGDKETSAMVEMCRANEKAKSDPVFKCVLDAKDEAAVRECYGTAFGDYMSKSKKTEAQLQLNKLGKSAKVAYVTNAEYPKGKVGPTPATPCCKGPDHKCAADPAAWVAPPWQALEFFVSEPHLFQYAYESDGQTAKATATGDLDCDGQTITYTLEMTVNQGNPEMKLTEPERNAD